MSHCEWWADDLPLHMQDPNHWYIKEEAMKVQAKSPCSSPMYVVVEESPNYYIAKDSNGFLINLRKSDYEPMREWEDVTPLGFSGVVTYVPGLEQYEWRLLWTPDPGYRLERRKK